MAKILFRMLSFLFYVLVGSPLAYFGFFIAKDIALASHKHVFPYYIFDVLIIFFLIFVIAVGVAFLVRAWEIAYDSFEEIKEKYNLA